MTPEQPPTRLSDAERTDAAQALQTHYAEGRLDLEEYDERASTIWNAKFASELATVFADLPAPAPAVLAPPAAINWNAARLPPPAPPRRHRHRGRMPWLMLTVLLVLALLLGAKGLLVIALVALGVWFLVRR